MISKPRTYKFRGGRYSRLSSKQKHEMALSRKETKERAFIRRQLINSKGAICELCGKPITDMKDCTIDHIIPVSKGGLTTLDNCRLAHKLCNVRRGNEDDKTRTEC